MATDERRDAVRTQLLDVAFKPGAGVDQRGRPLAWSLDCRELTLHGPTLASIASLLWSRIAAYRPDLVAGPTLSADPIVAALLLEAGRHGVALSGGLVRDGPKGYGLRKLVEGPPIARGASAVVVDDVLARGRSTARVVRALRELGAVAVAVVTIVDLEREDRLRLEGVEYETLFTATELGLTPFVEPPLVTADDWIVRGVNSPIPSARPVSPVAAGDETILSGDARGVVAVRSDGSVRWLHGPGTRCMDASGDLLVLGDATAVHAIERDSLRRRWTVDVAARAICCAPSPHVFVAGADVPELMLIDARDGTVIERRTLASPADALHRMDRVLVVLGAFGIAAVDRSLDLCWTRAQRAVAPASHGERLFLLTRGPTLTRLDPSDGSLVWSRAVGRRTLHQLAAAEDRIALAVESVAVGLSSAGGVRWVHSGPRRIAAGPVTCGEGRLAVVDQAGVVRVLDAISGEHVASYSSGDVRPISLSGSTTTLVALGCDGDAWGVDTRSRPAR
jgi:orotate phosphoribosyltransferase